MTSLELLESTMIDPLTGAASALGFEQRCAAEFDRFLRFHLRLSVLAVHADSSNPVSELGSAASDALSRALGVFLLANLRGTDILGRRPRGGFLILLPETGLAGAIILAERLHRSVGRITTRQGERLVPLTITIAAAELLKDADSLGPTLAIAEALLLRGRQSGGNQIVIET